MNELVLENYLDWMTQIYQRNVTNDDVVTLIF